MSEKSITQRIFEGAFPGGFGARRYSGSAGDTPQPSSSSAHKDRPGWGGEMVKVDPEESAAVDTTVERGGTVCPFCKSDKVFGGIIEDEGDGVASDNMLCETCHKTWQNVYGLEYIRVRPKDRGLLK